MDHENIRRNYRSSTCLAQAAQSGKSAKRRQTTTRQGLSRFICRVKIRDGSGSQRLQDLAQLVRSGRMPDKSDETSLDSESNEIDTYSGQLPKRGERRPALVFLRGELLAVQIPLDRQQVTLGRALEADIRINDSRASRLHARITTERDEETNETRHAWST